MAGARRCRISASSPSPDGPPESPTRGERIRRQARSRFLCAAVVVCLPLAGSCGGAGGDAADLSTLDDALPLVTENWRIAEMATAHGAFTVEVEVGDGVDTTALARELIQPLQDRYAEVLVYFHAREPVGDLPRLRVQWTAENGYVETRYHPGPAESARGDLAAGSRAVSRTGR